MDENIDKKLIKRYIIWCIAHDLNQTQMGEFVKRTKSWASLLVRGKIKKLRFSTRNRIKAILGIR